MQSRKFRVPQRKTQRRWRVPPALKRGDEVFEGLGLLDEVTGEKGLLLWQSLRDALLWAEAPEGDRASLFAADAERSRMAMLMAAAPAADLEEPLAALARMVGEPNATSEEMVSLACRRVAQWADEQGLLTTALSFAQAAATVTPGDASAAYAVGLLARRRAEHARAETWFRRAIALARQIGDWPTYSKSFLGLGRLYMQRGKLPVARKFLIRSIRAAQRNSLHTLEGMGLHGLFGVAVESERHEEAQELARAAFEAHTPGSAELSRLAQDVAYWWITQGFFARALPVLRSTLRHLTLPSDRLTIHGNIARASGGIGDRDGFREAWDACHDLLPEAAVDDRAAQTLLDLAHGAASLGLWDMAEAAARQALETGSRRHEAKIRFSAEALIDSVRHHRSAETAKRVVKPAVDEAGEMLAENLVRSLSATPA
ncbi:MAG: tetratricopeptide repeat protein [Gemmatimonadetes bacterium]|nr:tetratricopeptide repeat protein [Gemmatimonadota bacterium]